MGLNWWTDDGINLPMINDHARNQFYHQMLEPIVKNKNCIDIGFGTGLLSMIALQNGATHVTAYEKNLDRYNLGLEIIRECDLSDRITLKNQEYHHGLADADSLIFSEIFSDNIWSEGLWNCLPRKPSDNFLPSNIFLEILSVELPFQYMKNDKNMFDPGIHLDENFCRVLNKTIAETHDRGHLAKFQQNIKNNPRGGLQQLLMRNIKCDVIGGYRLNIADLSIEYSDAQGIYQIEPIDFNQEYITIQISARAYTMLITRCGFGHQDKRLYFYQTNCWNAGAIDCYVSFDDQDLRFNHNFINGQGRYFET